jgi:hypothetical protein
MTEHESHRLVQLGGTVEKKKPKEKQHGFNEEVRPSSSRCVRLRSSFTRARTGLRAALISLRESSGLAHGRARLGATARPAHRPHAARLGPPGVARARDRCYTMQTVTDLRGLVAVVAENQSTVKNQFSEHLAQARLSHSFTKFHKATLRPRNLGPLPSGLPSSSFARYRLVYARSACRNAAQLCARFAASSLRAHHGWVSEATNFAPGSGGLEPQASESSGLNRSSVVDRCATAALRLRWAVSSAVRIMARSKEQPRAKPSTA